MAGKLQDKVAFITGASQGQGAAVSDYSPKEPAPNIPEQFRAFIRAESRKYAKIIADANVKLDSN
jgi:hypothetical protein